MMLDGGSEFVRRLSGTPDALSMKPSDYFKRHVRVSSFAYELPANLHRQLGGADLLMCCSDYPHSEGLANPVDFADAIRDRPVEDLRKVMRDNALELVRTR